MKIDLLRTSQNKRELFTAPTNTRQATSLLYTNSPVVEQDVGALEVTMEEVFGVAVVESLHQLSGETLDVLLCEDDQARVQQTTKVVIAVLKDKVEGT